MLFGPPAGTKAAKANTLPAARGVTTNEDEEDDEFEIAEVRRADGGVTPTATSIRSERTSKASIPNLRRRYEEGSWAVQEDLEPFRTLRECPPCKGERLQARKPCGARQGTGDRRVRQPAVSEALEVFEAFELTEREALIATRVLREIRERLTFLHDVGVGYLTLNRSAATLSGGEGQRIRLATQIGANLTGVLYVLDEPSIGLHQRDNRKLLVDAGATCATWATPSSSSSTTRKRSGWRTGSSISDRAPASTAARSSSRAPRAIC